MENTTSLNNITSKNFGILTDGNEILSYTLRNKNDIELSVINYGATIISLKVPNSTNEKIDVVLGFEKPEDYIKSFELSSAPYIGAVVGRYAGRINNAEFILNNKKIDLNKNHNNHHIHGGFNGFSKAFWNLIELKNCEEPSITLEYISKENEENYPGELTTQVTYTLTSVNELKISFRATTSEDSIINLTQHSYFNLDGHQNNISEQELYVNADRILEVTTENIPTGNYIELKNHPFNFNNIAKCPQKIDNTFLMKEKDNVGAILFSKKNNLKMSVITDQPAIHIYVGGNCFEKIAGKDNTSYHNLSGICFEAQNFPDAPNHNNFPSAILKKGETYNHQTTFKFENLNT